MFVMVSKFCGFNYLNLSLDGVCVYWNDYSKLLYIF